MLGSSTQAYLQAASAAITSQRPLLDSIREINLRFLRSVRDGIAQPTYSGKPELGVVAPLFQSLSDEALDSASRFPFLLMDLGLARIGSPRELGRLRHNIADSGAMPHYPEHLAIARSALIAGWYACRTDNTAALLLFDFSAGIAQTMANLSLHEVEALAPSCISPPALRWRANPNLWRQLLNAEACESVEVVRGFVLHAVQLTAASHLK